PAPMKRIAIALAAFGCVWIGIESACSRSEKAPDVAQATEILSLPDPVERAIRWSALLGSAGPDALPGLRDAVVTSKLDVGDVVGAIRARGRSRVVAERLARPATARRRRDLSRVGKCRSRTCVRGSRCHRRALRERRGQRCDLWVADFR